MYPGPPGWNLGHRADGRGGGGERRKGERQPEKDKQFSSLPSQQVVLHISKQ